jgi:ketosteroid isomerase-like protein
MAEDMEQAVERVHAAYEAFNRGDFDAAVEFVHPEIEWERVAKVEQPLRGRDAVRGFMNPEAFERQRSEVHEMEIVGDSIIVHATFHGLGRGSGIELTQEGFHLWRVREGRAVAFRYFLDRDEAERAARSSQGSPSG